MKTKIPETIKFITLVSRMIEVRKPGKRKIAETLFDAYGSAFVYMDLPEKTLENLLLEFLIEVFYAHIPYEDKGINLHVRKYKWKAATCEITLSWLIKKPDGLQYMHTSLFEIKVEKEMMQELRGVWVEVNLPF